MMYWWDIKWSTWGWWSTWGSDVLVLHTVANTKSFSRGSQTHFSYSCPDQNAHKVKGSHFYCGHISAVVAIICKGVYVLLLCSGTSLCVRTPGLIGKVQQQKVFGAWSNTWATNLMSTRWAGMQTLMDGWNLFNWSTPKQRKIVKLRQAFCLCVTYG